jgi:hypothetical protein
MSSSRDGVVTEDDVDHVGWVWEFLLLRVVVVVHVGLLMGRVEMGFMWWDVAYGVFGWVEWVLISNGLQRVGYKTNATWVGWKLVFKV